MNNTNESLQNFIQQMPKAELHLHIEGTLEPELLFKLADRNKLSVPYHSIEEAHEAYKFKDLQSFLNVYYAGAKVLIHEEDFFDLTFEYLKKAKTQNIRHAEIFFDPQTHTNRGISFPVIIQGITEALKKGHTELKISSHLILCFLRDLSESDAFQTLKMALPFKELIIGVGLDSAEINNPPSKFSDVFKEARENGFLTVAHAGEEGPPQYIWEALDILKTKRIDHGVKCVKDERLMQRLLEEQIPLTVCPISNIKLRVFNKMKDHPLKQMLEYGLCATVNSDDPAYFLGYVNENFLEAARALQLTKNEIYQLTKNSFKASFLTDKEKNNTIKELDDFFKDFKTNTHLHN